MWWDTTKAVLEQVTGGMGDYPEIPWLVLGVLVLLSLGGAIRKKKLKAGQLPVELPNGLSPEGEALISMMNTKIDRVDGSRVYFGKYRVWGCGPYTGSDLVQQDEKNISQIFTNKDRQAISSLAKAIVTNKATAENQAAADKARADLVPPPKPPEPLTEAKIQRMINTAITTALSKIRAWQTCNVTGGKLVITGKTLLGTEPKTAEWTLPGADEVSFKKMWLEVWKAVTGGGTVVASVADRPDGLLVSYTGDNGHSANLLPKLNLANWSEMLAGVNGAKKAVAFEKAARDYTAHSGSPSLAEMIQKIDDRADRAAAEADAGAPEGTKLHEAVGRQVVFPPKQMAYDALSKAAVAWAREPAATVFGGNAPDPEPQRPASPGPCCQCDVCLSLRKDRT